MTSPEDRQRALDILEASPLDQLEPVCAPAHDLEETRDSDIVIITAGARRKEGMSRDELLKINADIVRDCAAKAAKYSPYAFFIVVSNPLTAMCHVAMRAGQIPRTRITGMAGILDASRFQLHDEIILTDFRVVVIHEIPLVPLGQLLAEMDLVKRPHIEFQRFSHVVGVVRQQHVDLIAGEYRTDRKR